MSDWNLEIIDLFEKKRSCVTVAMETVVETNEKINFCHTLKRYCRQEIRSLSSVGNFDFNWYTPKPKKIGANLPNKLWLTSS